MGEEETSRALRSLRSLRSFFRSFFLSSRHVKTVVAHSMAVIGPNLISKANEVTLRL